MNHPVEILLRPALAEESEREAAARYFRVVAQRTHVSPGALVVGRYSVLPYYRELCEDLAERGARLIHTPRQHAFLADIGEWSTELASLTPRTWDRLEDIPPGEAGPFIVKGRTNSRKDRFLTHMFARDRAALLEVLSRLYADTFLEAQGLVVRRFVPLRVLCDGVGGLPITNEYRCFVARGEVVALGYYWSNYADEPAVAAAIDPGRVPRSLLEDVIRRVGDRAEFYVIDVAETAEGEWIVIELNEGQMSGLSCVDPGELYAGLSRVLA